MPQMPTTTLPDETIHLLRHGYEYISRRCDQMNTDAFRTRIMLRKTICMRGEAVIPHLFGTLTSPRTYGNYGAGSTLFWVDPELDMTFVCLSTGVMKSADNIERFQRLSDIAVSAAI